MIMMITLMIILIIIMILFDLEHYELSKKASFVGVTEEVFFCFGKRWMLFMLDVCGCL